MKRLILKLLGHEHTASREQVLRWARQVREFASPPFEGPTEGLASEIVYTGMDDALIDLAWRMEQMVGGRDV